MSSSDRLSRGARRRSVWPVLAVAALAVSLAACTARPLYAPNPTGTTVASALDRITVDAVDTRIAQQVRNALIFDLNSRTGAPPAYRMALSVTVSEAMLGVSPVESAPSNEITVTTTYVVTSLADDKVVYRETVRASASYDVVNQAFANVRAKRDAENRAAVAVANDIRIRLSGAAARGVI